MPHAQLITYKVSATFAHYDEQMVQPDSAVFAEMDGLISKTWLADWENNLFGGFYTWSSKQAMTEFMASEMVATVLARRFLSDVHSSDWPINEVPSKANRGISTPD
jgi:hypothetical protein